MPTDKQINININLKVNAASNAIKGKKLTSDYSKNLVHSN